MYCILYKLIYYIYICTYTYIYTHIYAILENIYECISDGCQHHSEREPPPERLHGGVPYMSSIYSLW